MHTYALPTALPALPVTDRILAMGMFDGIHCGHRTVLTRALLCETLSPAVFTFDYGISRPKHTPALQTAAMRREKLHAMGFAEMFEADFDVFRNMSATDFVRFLRETLHVKALVCGFNFRFGKDAAGDVHLLQILCAENDIALTVAPPLLADGEPVSSTRIKAALRAGDMAAVQRLEGSPYTICAPVVSGNHIGHLLEAPTINQPLSSALSLPRFGVYASLVTLEGTAYCGVTNVGTKPTIGGNQPLAETYILDFKGDLYGQTVPVQLLRFLRPEQKFSSLEDLQQQIAADAVASRTVLQPPSTGKVQALIFDFDDTLTLRDMVFGNACLAILRQDFPSIAEEILKPAAKRLCAASHHGYAPFDEDVYTAVYQELGNPSPPPYAAFYARFKTQYPAATVLHPDAVPVLMSLRRKGYRLGLITNGDTHIQNRKLDISGIRPLFDTVLVGGDEKVHKPSPEIFLRAARRLGVAPADCVFVGDNPINDIQGAAAAGMQPVFIDRKHAGYTIPADSTVPRIQSFKELDSLY